MNILKSSLVFLFSLNLFAVACAPSQPTATPVPTAEFVQATVIPATAIPTLTPTRLPIETPIPLKELYQFDSKFISEPELAIAYSHNLLVLRGYERQGWSYDNALYTPVEFPDGAKGAFVALGFSGIARGYKLLYRLEQENRFRLIQLEDSVFDWGMDFGDRTTSEQQKVPLKHPELLYDANGNSEQLIQLTGSAHQGTGLWNNGFFEVLKITDSGWQVLFSGTHFDANFSYRGDYKQYAYEYLDVDGDANKEIIQTGKECKVGFIHNNEQELTDCKTIHKIYKYDGEVFTEQP